MGVDVIYDETGLSGYKYAYNSGSKTIQLSDKEYTDVLVDLNSLLEKHVSYMRGWLDRNLLFGNDLRVNLIQYIKYLDDDLWELFISATGTVSLKLSLVLLLLVKEIIVPDSVDEVILFARSDNGLLDNKYFIKDKDGLCTLADIVYTGDIKCNKSVYTYLIRGHNKCILCQANFRHLGYMYNLYYSLHNNYKRPAYTVRYCKFLSLYVRLDLLHNFDDVIDWVKDTEIRELQIKLECCSLDTGDKDLTIYNLCYDRLMKFLKHRYEQGLKELRISGELYNDRFIQYRYADYENLSVRLGDDLQDMYDRLNSLVVVDGVIVDGDMDDE